MLLARCSTIDRLAVGAVGKSRKEIRLVHVLRRAFFVRAHLLHDIPLLFLDQRGVRVLHNGAFAFGAVHRRFVLVGYRCGAQAYGVSEIDLVVKDPRDGAAAPRIGAGEIQLGMALFVILVIIIAWRQHLFLTENPGDLIGTFAGGAQREDLLYHRRGFVVGDEFLGSLCSPFCSRKEAVRRAALPVPPAASSPHEPSCWNPLREARLPSCVSD